MKKIILILIAVAACFASLSQTKITVTATPTTDGGVVVSWVATFVEQGPMSLTVSVAWAKQINDKTIWTGSYGWWAYSTNGSTIETSGTRTVYPPPGTNFSFATVVGNACSRIGPDMDDYICAPTFRASPVRLSK